jgi:hypothetical protein
MRWRALGLVSALALVTVAGCSDQGTVDQSQSSYQFSEPIGALTVNARAGKVTIGTADGPTTVTETLQFSGSKPSTSHRLDGQTLQLTDSGCPGINLRCDVAYQISVPRQAAAQVTTRAGLVTVQGLAGALNVTSDAASVSGADLASDQTTVTTKAGFVKLTYQSPPGLVNVQTDAGAIELKVPGATSYAVEVTKKVGVDNITVVRDANSTHKISIRSNVGAVSVSPS